MTSRDAVELVESAISNHGCFKKAAQHLDALPSDPAAVEVLLGAFRIGDAPPWLTAHLLGCIGHKSGYAAAREILFAAPGMLAESYAGVALAKIGGRSALDDLTGIIREAPKRVSREGAAYGLGHLASRQAVVVLLAACREELIGWDTAGGILATLPITAAEAIALLRSDDPRDVRLGTEVISMRDGARMEEPPSWSGHDLEQLSRVVQDSLRRSDVRMAPRKRRRLSDWVHRVSRGENR